ncbi:hypothetical protein ACFQ9Z_03735 [Streptomyces sp. NPDC056580]|uniref:hypothetical protein n=1 Tax=Streptomyces sp. NPDC056580 TaxID=3345872 RepID=UPI0036988083
MHIDVNTLITTGGTLASVALGAGLTALVNSRVTANTEAKQERDNLGAQFDAMLVAVAGLRAVVEADRVLWSNWKEQGRTFLLAAVTGLAPASFVRGSDRREIAAALGGAGWFLAHERHQSRTASAGITPKLEAVVAAAAPLQRHPSREVVTATDTLMTTVFNYHEARNPQQLEAAAADFGVAVRAVLHASPRRRLPWRRGNQ